MREPSATGGIGNQRKRGWTDAALPARAKGDVEKVLMATRLLCETTVTLQ